jgi:hypothetical protein
MQCLLIKKDDMYKTTVAHFYLIEPPLQLRLLLFYLVGEAGGLSPPLPVLLLQPLLDLAALCL